MEEYCFLAHLLVCSLVHAYLTFSYVLNDQSRNGTIHWWLGPPTQVPHQPDLCNSSIHISLRVPYYMSRWKIKGIIKGIYACAYKFFEYFSHVLFSPSFILTFSSIIYELYFISVYKWLNIYNHQAPSFFACCWFVYFELDISQPIILMYYLGTFVKV